MALKLRTSKTKKGKLRSRPQNTQYYFREGISWNDTTATGKIAFRYQLRAIFLMPLVRAFLQTET